MLLDVIDDDCSMTDVIAALLDQVFKDNSHLAKLIICDVKEEKSDVEPR